MAPTEAIKKNPRLAQFLELLPKEASILIEELWEGPKAVLLALLREATQKHILVISSSSEDRLFNDLFFFSQKNIVEFPSWETLPS